MKRSLLGGVDAGLKVGLLVVVLGLVDRSLLLEHGIPPVVVHVEVLHVDQLHLLVVQAIRFSVY